MAQEEVSKVELRPITVCAATHERVRSLAFDERVSMRVIVERALADFYGWPLPEGVEELQSDED